MPAFISSETFFAEKGDPFLPKYLVEAIEYEYPAYTKLPTRIIQRQGDIKAVEGTKVTVRARTNQPIAAAVLEFDPPAQDAEAAPAADRLQSGPLATSAHRVEMEFREQEAWCSFVCELDEQRQEPKHRTYQLRFSTPGGHRNPQPVPVRAAYTWTGGALEATVRSITTPFRETYVCRFSGGALEMVVRSNVSFGPLETPPIRGTRA